MKSVSGWSQARLVLLYLALELAAKALLIFLFGASTNDNGSAASETLNELSTIQLIFLVVFLGPIVEELLFRFCAQNAIQGCLLKFCTNTNHEVLQSWSIVASALAFALAHDETYMVFFLSHLIFGLFAGHLYVRTQTISTPIALHCLNNAIAVLAMKLL